MFNDKNSNHDDNNGYLGNYYYLFFGGGGGGGGEGGLWRGSRKDYRCVTLKQYGAMSLITLIEHSLITTVYKFNLRRKIFIIILNVGKSHTVSALDQ